jgi:hypothetical protein
VKHHVEEKPWFLQAEQSLEDHEMSGTAHGKELRDSLNDSQEDGLEKRKSIFHYLVRYLITLFPMQPL